MIRRANHLFCAALLVWFASALCAWAQVSDTPEAALIPITEASVFEERASQLDKTLSDAASEERFSGAIAGLVTSDGDTWTGAYGLREQDPDLAISTSSTQFLLASVTKTMTSISVLQLYERGDISSLDDPANDYLTRIQLPTRNGKQVTVRHLLTHTSGLRTLGFGFIRREQLEAPVSASFVKKHTGDLVRDPGEALVYSNLGMSLLGVLVEDITGETLKAFMERELFAPLGMSTAVLNYEISPSSEHAKTYYAGSESGAEIPFDANTPFLAPAGSAMLSAEDFARYGAFWLDRGETWSSEILSADTFAEMISPQKQNHPGAEHVGLGVFIEQRGDKTLLNHSGAFGGYTSMFMVSPQTGMAGFIVTAGRPAPGGASSYLAYADGASLLSRLLLDERAPVYDPQPIENAGQYSGLYVNARRFSRGVPKMLGLLSPMSVTADANGFLTINGTSGFGLVSDGVIATPGNGESTPRAYGLPTADQPFFQMNADRARRAGFFETPQNLIFLLGAGALFCLIGVIRVFGPSTGPALWSLSKWTPLIGLVGVLGVFASLQLFYSPGTDIGYHLVAGETLRTSLINIFSWLIMAAGLFAFIRLAKTLFFSDEKNGWVWISFETVAVIGLIALSLFVFVTGLADPFLV